MVNYVEQVIKKTISIPSGTTGELSVSIPRDVNVFLRGYGYSWRSQCVFKLSTGQITFPARTDQEGSISQPVIYAQPYECRSGRELKLIVTNNGASSDFTAVFYILTSSLLADESDGANITFDTGLISTEIGSTASFVVVNENDSYSITGSVFNIFDLDNTTSYEATQNINSDDFSITFDLGTIRTINSVNTRYSGIAPSGATNAVLTFEYSSDGSSWTTLNSYTGVGAIAEHDESYSDLVFRYLRFDLQGGSGTNTLEIVRLAINYATG